MPIAGKFKNHTVLKKRNKSFTIYLKTRFSKHLALYRIRQALANFYVFLFFRGHVSGNCYLQVRRYKKSGFFAAFLKVKFNAEIALILRNYNGSAVTLKRISARMVMLFTTVSSIVAWVRSR